MSNVSIELDDREVRALLAHIEKAVPNGVMGVVWSRGAQQQGRRYDHYVMSERHQAGIHRGRWQTDHSIVKKNQQPAVAIYKRHMARVINRQEDNLKDATEETLELVFKDATAYPPERPNQTYVRTGILRASWDKENKL